jgi:hypothetical protein
MTPRSAPTFAISAVMRSEPISGRAMRAPLRSTDTIDDSQDMMTPKPLTARAEGGTHDGERFDISEVTVGLLLNSRRNATGLEYYEVVLYMGGNLLAFVRDYDVAEWRGAIASRPASTGPA